MNADLEATLAELGESTVFADALRGAPSRRVDAGFAARTALAVRAASSREARLRRCGWWAAAASVAALAATSFSFLRPAPAQGVPAVAARTRVGGTSAFAPYMQAFEVSALARRGSVAPLREAVAALVASQTAEGGWANPETSARNVAALAAADKAGEPTARAALRRGRRYLRANGIPELDAASFAREARRARERLGDAAPQCLDFI